MNLAGEMGEESLHSFDLLRTYCLLTAHVEIEAWVFCSAWCHELQEMRCSWNPNPHGRELVDLKTRYGVLPQL